MGNEARCRVEIGGETADDAKALLETEELIVRGPLRAKIRFGDARDVVSRGGVLELTWQNQPVRIHLGADADKWAQKIRNPKSVLDKLGVKSGQRVSAIAVDDAFVAQLEAIGADVSRRARKDSDVIFFGATRREELARLAELLRFLVANGAIWVIRPKGIATITESDVLAAGKAAGLVDVKVVKFSETHTAEKLVIPVTKRSQPGRSRPG